MESETTDKWAYYSGDLFSFTDAHPHPQSFYLLHLKVLNIL